MAAAEAMSHNGNMAGLNFLRSTSTASNGDRGGNGQSITCYRQVQQQAYCAERWGCSGRSRPGATAGRLCRSAAASQPHNGALRVCRRVHHPGAQRACGGINVYRVDPTSGAWSHEQLLEIANPSFLTLDRAQRFLYSVHADLEEVSAYAIDKQNGRITALNRQSCGGKNPVHLSIDPTGRWIITANYSAGTVGVVPIEKDGNLGPRSDLVNLP